MRAVAAAAQKGHKTYIVKSVTKGTNGKAVQLAAPLSSPQLAPVFEGLSGMPLLGDPGSGKGTILRMRAGIAVDSARLPIRVGKPLPS